MSLITRLVESLQPEDRKTILAELNSSWCANCGHVRIKKKYTRCAYCLSQAWKRDNAKRAASHREWVRKNKDRHAILNRRAQAMWYARLKADPVRFKAFKARQRKKYYEKKSSNPTP